MSDDTDHDVIPPARSFATLLGYIENGAFLKELSEATRDMIAEMSNRQLDGAAKVKGKIVLTLALTLDRGSFDLVPKFDIKLPEQPRDRSIFWATRDNDLTPENPKQMKMDLRRVDDRREERRVS